MDLQEVFAPAFPKVPSGPHISYNLPFRQALVKHVTASRIFIIGSGSLCQNTDIMKDLEADFGNDRITGTYQGVKPHTLWSQVLEIMAAIYKSSPGCLITLGAGSITDAAKVAVLAVANGCRTFEDLAQLQRRSMTSQETVKPAMIEIVCVPTSLSGGEYSAFAGATNDQTHHKEPFAHPSIAPRLIILDPDLCKTTPSHVWLSSGVRAVDHCVEAICSLQSKPEADADAARALRLLVPGLLGTHTDASSIDSRLQCQLGVVESMKAVQLGVPMGASHGIGHQLGPFGVGHGETSCIMLPAVMKFNESVNHDKQTKVINILWSESTVSKLLIEKGCEKDSVSLSAVLDIIIRELGLPRSLSDVGVDGEKIQDQVAEASLTDKYCKTNPIPLVRKDQVLEILKMVH
ncbi:hypothetical protein F5884DRAFT_717144 [Xylogone sp. PMI_703]|nr:hypothetical protein F5884DRAFT_717144 [Xylogone sp. PMI_703]